MLEKIGFGELMVILIVALLVFGPGKLPELGKSMGKAIREFKNATREFTSDIADAVQEPKKS